LATALSCCYSLSPLAIVRRKLRPALNMHVTDAAHNRKAAMPIFSIQHVTTYHYRKSVDFGEHRMMLHPRDDSDQRVLRSGIAITPEPSRINWMLDDFGNHVAVASFAARANKLRFDSSIIVDQACAQFDAADIADYARSYPFCYAAADAQDVTRYIAQPSRHPQLTAWASSFLREDGGADTHALLVGMTEGIRRTFQHGARHQHGTRDPLETLTLGGGSCRDLAVLMIAALRTLGIAARFVSGYLNLADPDDDSITGGNTHAWVQAFVPGPGWVDFDPSSGNVGNENLVRLAAVDEPQAAVPLQGTFIGFASDHLAMDVAVRVAAR
jgi:transglutaminase-like putative cysteine protease